MRFDPFGQLARLMPEARLHLLIRLAMVAILAGFLIHQISEYRIYFLKPLWLVETLLFVILIAAFLLRSLPCNRSSGIREIVIPLVGSALPFALLLSPPSAMVTGNRALLLGALWWMTAATALTAAGIFTLRSAFSITVEARRLVTGGPYRLIRHPVYLGEMLATAGLAFIRCSAINAVLLILFIAIQLYRSRLEEEKLNRVFPEYRTFAAKSRWFW